MQSTNKISLEIRRVFVTYPMLSIAVKNAILVILIVLILHFLLKNYLLERSGQSSLNKSLESFGGSVSKDPLQPAPLSAPMTQDIESVSAPLATESKSNDAASELFKCVFDDSSVLQTPESPQCKPQSLSSVPEPSSIKPAKQPEKQTINFDNLVLNEYDNESELNGGNIFNSLKGFDSLAGDYMAYEPIAVGM